MFDVLIILIDGVWVLTEGKQDAAAAATDEGGGQVAWSFTSSTHADQFVPL